mgnify:CR=1 FL=1
MFYSEFSMDTIEILRTASKLVYENVKDLAGTKEAVAGNFGRGAGGDISQNIDMIAEKTVCLLYTSPSPRDLSTSRMPSSA